MKNTLWIAAPLAIAMVAAPLAHGESLTSLAAPLLGQAETPSAGPAAGDVIPGRFILTLDPTLPELLNVSGLQAAVQQLLTATGGGEVLHLYDTAFTGAAVALSETQAALLSSMPGVEAVEPDRVVMASGTQQDATWGLDRVDQAYLPLNDRYAYPADAGAGVTVYVIDTGLRSSHTEFAGRVGTGRNFAGTGGLGLPLLGLLGASGDPEDTSDCNGHGTHVASTAVGTEYGVAKAAEVAPVRVLNCAGAGSNSDVIAGVDWVAENHQAPAVANMSLGGGNSDALDQAVRGAIDEGVSFVVAAGNDDADACSGSPNRVAEAVTVGSTTRNDERSSFSNHGSCLDLFAPGSNITAAWYQSDDDTNTISGTSMASPHVAGNAALLLAADGQLTPAAVHQALVQQTTGNVLSGIKAGSPNRLLRVQQ